ncbi:MAG: hypothetical protein ACUVTL_08485 [Thermoproteota archaeon]
MTCWVYSVSADFARPARVEISSIYIIREGNTFIVSVAVKNIGGSETTIEKAYLNGEMCSSNQLPLVLKAGQNEVLRFEVAVGKGLESGVIVQVTLYMIKGLTCSTLTILP